MKFKKLIKLFINCKFNFHQVPQKKIILFDCENVKNIKKLFLKKEFFILSNRYENLKIIYLNWSLFKTFLKNYNYKKSLKINYLYSLISLINPKLIITNIDNSRDFHILSKLLYKKICCVAVQMANRGDILYNPISYTKKFFIPNYFCFSEYEKKLFKKKQAIIKKFYPIGSLTSAFANKFIKLKKKNLLLKYDICLISQPFDGIEFPQVKNFSKVEGLIAKFTHRLCKEKNLSLVFVGKRKKNTTEGKQEIQFYNNYLGEKNFKILQPTKENYLSYQKILQSEIIIGHNSTLLREAIGFKKKVLYCNFTGSKLIEISAKGVLELKSPDYEDFKRRVLKIIKMSKFDYFKKIDKNSEKIICSPNNTIKLITSKLAKLVK